MPAVAVPPEADQFTVTFVSFVRERLTVNTALVVATFGSSTEMSPIESHGGPRLTVVTATAELFSGTESDCEPVTDAMLVINPTTEG